MSTRRRKHKRKLHRISTRETPGGVPGELKHHAEASETSVQVLKYNRYTINQHEVDQIADIEGLLSDDSIIWVNVNGLSDLETLKQLGKIFNLHQLAVEDVANVCQRPKVEEYDDHLFVVLQVISRCPDNRHLQSQQLSIFFGKNFVLTFEEDEGNLFDQVRQRLLNAKGRVRGLGADYLAYVLIDAVIDAYYPIVDVYGERMERLDDLLSVGHRGNFMGILHETRGDLMFLRRAIRPLRDELMQLTRDSHALITEDTVIHLRDCYDHGYQLIELVDNYREMCSNLREYYLSIVNNRMNEVMKVLTIISTVFIPLSFITGLYGMNFNPQLPGNMPELNWPYGYVFALLAMLTIALGLIYFVWSKGWLNGTGTKIDEFDTFELIEKTEPDISK